MEVRIVSEGIRDKAVKLVADNCGSLVIITRGRVHNVVELPGLAVMDSGRIIGLLFYHIENGDCEIVALDSFRENVGVGSRLLREVEQEASRQGCKRVWLITTNDNIHALRFYQKRGYVMKALYYDAMKQSRELKPSIPLYGNDGIPIMHEIEFEKELDSDTKGGMPPCA